MEECLHEYVEHTFQRHSNGRMPSRLCGAHVYQWLAATFGFMDTIADEDLWMPGSVTHIWLELSAMAPGVNVLLAKPMLWEGRGSANL